MRSLSMFTLSFVSLAACGDDGGTINPNEVITTVRLEFVPENSSSAPVTAVWSDPDGDGGAPPTIDPIVLATPVLYTVTVRFLNELETPPEEITDEVRDEATEHQVFLTGSGINGPASDQPAAILEHVGSDQDPDGLPLGLSNTIRSRYLRDPGELTVTLRHLPPINGTPTKTSDLEAQVRAGGFAAIGGETDASVTFMVMAQ